MKHIIEAFSAVILILLSAYASVAIIAVSGDIIAAREYKAAMVAEIENSDFNETVIQACIAQARQAGYEAKVEKCIYDEKNRKQMAEVILSYQYQLPLFGISDRKMTRGIAR